MRGVLLALILLSGFAIPAFAHMLTSSVGHSQPVAASCWTQVNSSNFALFGSVCSRGAF
ncbi:MAG TPA: hypothetical protein VGM83_09860 [Devosiaceae bacterium]|jgi:hypothetical protein